MLAQPCVILEAIAQILHKDGKKDSANKPCISGELGYFLAYGPVSLWKLTFPELQQVCLTHFQCFWHVKLMANGPFRCSASPLWVCGKTRQLLIAQNLFTPGVINVITCCNYGDVIRNLGSNWVFWSQGGHIYFFDISAFSQQQEGETIHPPVLEVNNSSTPWQELRWLWASASCSAWGHVQVVLSVSTGRFLHWKGVMQ